MVKDSEGIIVHLTREQMQKSSSFIIVFLWTREKTILLLSAHQNEKDIEGKTIREREDNWKKEK